jgi:hypothetical protein
MLCEWVSTAELEISAKQQELDALHSIEADAVEAERRWRELNEPAENNRELPKRAADAAVVSERFDKTVRRVAEVETELERLAEAVLSMATDLKAEHERLGQVRELEPLHQRRRELPSQSQQSAAVSRAEREMRAATSVRDEASQRLADQEQILEAARQTGTLRRRWKGLPAPEEQEATVSRAREHLALVGGVTEEMVSSLVSARSLMDEIEKLDRALQPWDSLGSVRKRQQAVGVCERALVKLEDQQRALSAEAEGLGAEVAEDDQVLEAYGHEYGERPAATLERLDTDTAAAAAARTTLQSLLDEGQKRRDGLGGW